jgi:hypothetical protein
MAGAGYRLLDRTPVEKELPYIRNIQIVYGDLWRKRRIWPEKIDEGYSYL